MFMDNTIYINNVCLNLQNIRCGIDTLADMFIEATMYGDYLKGWEQ